MTSTKPFAAAAAIAVLTLLSAPAVASADTSPSAQSEQTEQTEHSHHHGSHHGGPTSSPMPSGSLSMDPMPHESADPHAGHGSHGSSGDDGHAGHDSHDSGDVPDSGSGHTDHGDRNGAADTVSGQSRTYVLGGFGIANAAVLAAAYVLRRRVTRPVRRRGTR